MILESEQQWKVSKFRNFIFVFTHRQHEFLVAARQLTAFLTAWTLTSSDERPLARLRRKFQQKQPGLLDTSQGGTTLSQLRMFAYQTSSEAVKRRLSRH